MLTGLLNQHPDIKSYGQIFKDNDTVREDMKRMGVNPYNGLMFDGTIEQRQLFDRLEASPKKRAAEEDPSIYVENFFRVYERLMNCKYVGAKIHGGSIFIEKLTEVLRTRKYRVILLHRENLLRAAVSWYVAKTTDHWVARKEGQRQKLDLEIPLSHLEWFIENSRRDVRQWEAILKNNNIDYMDLTYECLCESDGIVDVFRFFGCNETYDLKSITYKLIDDSRYKEIRNYHDIKDALESSVNGCL